MSENKNCPFYGAYTIVERNGSAPALELPPVFMEPHGAQCALMGYTRADCSQERDGQAVDWHACPVLRESACHPGQW